jgi:hypothetical protein
VQFIAHNDYDVYANEYRTLFIKMNSSFIIGGNNNAKHTHWSSRLTTTKCRGLYSYKAAADTGCEVSTVKPTYWPTDSERTADLIDFFVVKNISTNYIKIEEGFDLNSDHLQIYITISDKIITKDQKRVSLTNTQTRIISIT